MKGQINLLVGTPNDGNRDYLPKEIKDTDMVVNENGNNSQVYPKDLIEFKECILDEEEDIWYEYVPASYDPSKKTPLVISMHGGLMTGWGQCIYSSWSLIADREGFIVLFPTAHSRGFWVLDCEEEKAEELTTPNDFGIYMHPIPASIEENRDANFVLSLIERMKGKYNIDESRIYMQGMSMGNAMTFMMAKNYGNLFAAMAGSAGATREGLLYHKDGSLINDAGPVAIWQSRVELDNSALASEESYERNVENNRNYWLQINECEGLPEIKIQGDMNLAFYKGRKADYVFCDVKNRDHGQTFDDAEYVWSYLFSGVSRDASGMVVNQESDMPRKGDTYSFAAGEGCCYAWSNNRKIAMPGPGFLWQKLKYHGLNGDTIVRGEYLMIPAETLVETFGGQCQVEEDGAKIQATLADGRKLQFAKGCIGCVVDNHIQAMLCEAVEREGVLYIPAQWFCGYLHNMHVSTCGKVMYATDHNSQLSANMAYLIQTLLMKEKKM